MNLQQLEYLIAVDKLQHFGKAAKYCNVSQPTLSAMIHKLEQELDVYIFDRSSHPIRSTDAGKMIIEHAKKVLHETKSIQNVSSLFKNNISGTLKIGIIPTVAPHIIPKFIIEFLNNYAEVLIEIKELTSQNIIHQLSAGLLDVGIISTPYPGIQGFFQDLLYVEELLIYNKGEALVLDGKQQVIAKKMDIKNIWLLEEGNCLTNQFKQICGIDRQRPFPQNLIFNASSVITLTQMVDSVSGISVLPKLAIQQLNEEQKKNVFRFQPPHPAREISMIYYKPTFKQKMIDVLLHFLREKVDKELNFNRDTHHFNIIKAF